MDLLTKEKEIEVVIIDEVIYKDDTIRRIKEKIVLNCDMNVSTSEIFLMGCINKLNIPSIIYNRLTQDNKFDLTYDRICTFLSNIVNESQDANTLTHA